ncbi:hypothetical protein KA001_00245 [Patescibacteria group bacterium]|nr:hypothetical protein [Patescibacteria group bacterium]
MLSQNVKGLLTLILVFSLVGGSLYLYKVFIEPKISTSDNAVSTLPVDIIAEQEEIIPKIEVFASKADITFNTPEESLGAVKYCLKNDPKSCSTVTEKQLTKDHKIEITELESSLDYDYKIIIDGTEYPDGETYFSFKTTNQEQGNESIKTAFEEAIKTQDLTFDYNNDQKVSIMDYRVYSQQN